jgi:hypothetical protein
VRQAGDWMHIRREMKKRRHEAGAEGKQGRDYFEFVSWKGISMKPPSQNFLSVFAPSKTVRV